MNTLNQDLLTQFKSWGFELLYADIIHTEAFEEACARSLEFEDKFLTLTGNFYDDIEQAGLLVAYKQAIWGNVEIGNLKGFYTGEEVFLNEFYQSEVAFQKALKKFLRNDDIKIMWHVLSQQAKFTHNPLTKLKEIIYTINQELDIAQDFFSWGCIRVGFWFEEHALGLKSTLLTHIESPSSVNNLLQFYENVANRHCLKPALKEVLIAFYQEKQSTPECLDTSPLFTVISQPALSNYYPLLFCPFYIDGIDKKSSKKGLCLFDVNETSTHPERLGLTAFGFALKERQVDIAYALLRSKAQFTHQEFAMLVHFTISELDETYQAENIKKLNMNTFNKMNEMLEGKTDKCYQRYTRRFRRLFHAWLVRCSDLERQELFLGALNDELLALAMLLFGKAGVNINSMSEHTGKTLLHIAVEQKSPKAILTICAQERFNLNQLDSTGRHVLQLSQEPSIIAPVVYYLLVRSNDAVLMFLSRKIQSLLEERSVTPTHQQAIALIDEVKKLVLAEEEIL